METSEEVGWVTGPALETALAFDAIQVGDEVKLRVKGAPEYNIRKSLHGQVARIVVDASLKYRDSWEDGHYPVKIYGPHCYRVSRSDYWIRDVHIAAWKPGPR